MNNFFGLFNENTNEVNSTTLKPPLIMNFENKDLLFAYHFRNLTNKCMSMFKWENLPETIPQRVINLQLIMQGYTIIFENNGKLYCSYGGLGGKFDYNYMPTLAIVANPYLNIVNRNLKIDTDCVVIPNDSLYMGLVPINRYYATQLVENDQSMNCSLINARLMQLLVSKDTDVKKSLDEVINDLKKGKISSAIGDNFLTEAIQSLPFSDHSTNNIIQLLEHKQYIKGSWYNELGVQSNYNMKRETITSSENILNVDSLLPLVDDMMEQRKVAIDKINKMFGVNWSVDFSSSWKKIRDEIEVKEQIDQKDIDGESTHMENKETDKKVEEKENDTK